MDALLHIREADGTERFVPYGEAAAYAEAAKADGVAFTVLRSAATKDGRRFDVPEEEWEAFEAANAKAPDRAERVRPFKDDSVTHFVTSDGGRYDVPNDEREAFLRENARMGATIVSESPGVRWLSEEEADEALGGGEGRAGAFLWEWGANLLKGAGQVGILAPKAVVGLEQLTSAALEQAASLGGLAENPVSRLIGEWADHADANRRWLDAIEARWLETRPRGLGKGAEVAYDVAAGARDLAGQLLLGGAVARLTGLARGAAAAPRVAPAAPALRTTLGEKAAAGARALARQPKAYPALMAGEQFGETHAAARGNGKAAGEAFSIAGMDALNSYLLSVADQVGGSLTRAAGEGLGRSAKAWFLQGLREPTGGAMARKILRGVGIEAGTEALDTYQHLTALQEAGVPLTEEDKLAAAAVGGLYGAVASGFAEGVGAAQSRRARALARQLWAAERLAGAEEARRAAQAHRAARPEAGDVRLPADEPGGARLVRGDGSVLFGDGTVARADGTLRTAGGVVTDGRGEPETVAPPRGGRTTAGDVLDLFGLIRGADVKTVNLPTEGLRVNDRIRQFKEDADPETGVVAGERLEGAFQPIPSKPILVMEFEDGAREVVTGRHRLDLARRNGMATIPANVIRERDGWTPEAARVMDAYDNILDGKGSDQDFVHFFRTTKLDEETIAAHPELWARKRQRDARAVARGATEDLYSLVMGRDRHMTLDVAAAIVREAPEGGGPYAANIQRAVTRAVLDEGLRADDAAIMARSLRQAYAARVEAKGARQLDLFGDDETFELAMGLEAKFAARKAAEIDHDLRALKTAAGRQSGNLSVREGLAGKYGLRGPDDAEGMAKAIERLETEKRRWQNYYTDPELARQASAFARASLHMDDPAAELPDGRMTTLDGALSEMEGRANAARREEAARSDAREAEAGALFSPAPFEHDEAAAVRRAFTGPDGRMKAGWMKAPNGRPTNLGERQWLQVRTPSFKAWFGDWENDPANASKVLDENGEPKVVYHRTDAAFRAFDIGMARQSMDLPAAYFSSGTEDWEGMGERVVAAFLNLRNPREGKPSAKGEGRVVRDALIREGYDGTVEREEGMETEYGVFDPRAIKSATDNSGAFDPGTDDILLSPAPKGMRARTVPGAGPGRFMVGLPGGKTAALEAGDGTLWVSGLAGSGAPRALLRGALGQAGRAQVALTPEDARAVGAEGLGEVMAHNRRVAKAPAERFFAEREGSVRVPLFLLRPGREEPEASVREAARRMRLASRGEMARRAPVDVAANADGTYTVVDGNASSLAMGAMGGCEVVARVVGRDTGTWLGNSALALANVGPGGDGALRARGLDGLEPALALEKAYRQAEANAPRLAAAVETAARAAGGRARMRTGPKGIARAAEKVANDYGGDASRLADLAGGTIVLPDGADFGEALKALKKALPEGAGVARVKKLRMGDDDVGYGDIKVSVRFPNGGLGEVILVSEYMDEAKHSRGGHLVYEIQRVLDKYKDLGDADVNEALDAIDELSNALYARGPDAPDAAAFESMKARASSSVTRLAGANIASRLSARDIDLVKSLSSELHLAKPPSQDSYAMPSLSLIKNAMAVPPNDEASVAQSDALRQAAFPTAEDPPPVPEGVEANALPRSPLEVTVYPNGGRVPVAGSPAADASALPLRLDHVVALYRQLAGKFPKVVARRDRGPRTALGWFDPKTQDVMVRAQLFGLLDASDRQTLHDRLRARGLFRNEDPAWCAAQTRGTIDHERRFSEARLGEVLRGLVAARVRAGLHTGAGAKVMAHELWHLIDASDGVGVRGHGNLLGHLANLKGSFAKSLPEEAFASDGELMAEAGDFIRWWRGVGFDEAHFAQAHEAYAEMGAALFLDPGAVRRRAPRFYAAMLEGMKRHPKAFEAWAATQRAIEEGRDGKDLVDRLERGWAAAAEAEERRLAAAVTEPTPFDRRMEAARTWLDRHAPMVMVAERSQEAVRRRLAADLRAGNITREDHDARVAELDEELLDIRFRKNLYTHQYGTSKLFLADLHGKVFRASERLGVGMRELALYLHLQRVIELGGRATAYGIDPPRARGLLNEMARTKGLARMRDIRRLANVFRALYEQHVINNADVRAMLGEKTIAMMERNKHYITMRHGQDPEEVERWLGQKALFARERPGQEDPLDVALQEVRGLTAGGGRSGVGWAVHRLEGSFRPTKDPVSATAQTAVEILEAANKNAAVMRLAHALEGHAYPGFKVLGPGDRRVENRRFGTLEFMEGGARRAVRVPRPVADAFNASSLTVPMLTRLTRFLNASYTTNAPTFALTALPRDLNSLSQNIKGLRRSPLYWLTALNVGALIPGVGPLKAVKGLADAGAWATLAAQAIPPHVMRAIGENPVGRLIFGRGTVEYWTSFGNKIARIIQNMDFEGTLEAAARARAAGNEAKARELEYCATMARHALEDGVLLTMNQTRRDDYQTSDLGRLFDRYRLRYERETLGERAREALRSPKALARAAGRLAARPLTAYWETAGYINELESMTVKLAGYCFLHDQAAGARGYDARGRKAIALKAADRAGDPDFSAKGMAANLVEMFASPFWNARKEGLLRTARAAREAPGDWTGKMIAHAMAPRLVSLLLSGGALTSAALWAFFDGDEEEAREAMANGSAAGELYRALLWQQAALRNVSPYVQENFRVVPLWMNAAGTATFSLKIPIPDEARIADMATLALWNQLGLASPSPARNWADVARALGDQALFDPSGQGSALAFLGAWAGPYLFGANVWQSYRQATMYDEDEMKARWKAPRFLAKSVARELWNASPLVGALRLRRTAEGEAPEDMRALRALFGLPLVGPALMRLGSFDTEGLRQTALQHAALSEQGRAASRLVGREAAERMLRGEPTGDEVWKDPDAVGYMQDTVRRAWFDRALGPKGRALEVVEGIRDPEERMRAARWVNGR